MRKFFKNMYDDLKFLIDTNVAAYKADEKGIIDTIMAVVVGAIFLIVGIYVYSVVVDVMPNPTNTTLNETSVSVTSTVADAFNLLVIVFIVMAAVAILSVLLTGMMVKRGN